MGSDPDLPMPVLPQLNVVAWMLPWPLAVSQPLSVILVADPTLASLLHLEEPYFPSLIPTHC